MRRSKGTSTLPQILKGKDSIFLSKINKTGNFFYMLCTVYNPVTSIPTAFPLIQHWPVDITMTSENKIDSGM